jgi:hypothetical protein
MTDLHVSVVPVIIMVSMENNFITLQDELLPSCSHLGASRATEKSA